MPGHSRFFCQPWCGRRDWLVQLFGRMDIKGSFLARDTRSHQGDGTYVIRLSGIFGIFVRSTMVLLGMFRQVNPMQPMVQWRAGNGQLGQNKLR